MRLTSPLPTIVPFLRPWCPAPLDAPLTGEEEGFDPMGFSLAIDIRWLREAERGGRRVGSVGDSIR